MDIIEHIGSLGVVPIVSLEHAADSIPTTEALLSGGVDTMEIALRTDAAFAAISTVAQNCPQMVIGAGTVLNLKQCQKAVDHGARFIVSPGYDDDVITWCMSKQIPVIPGCVTPTEIMAALSHGLKIVKFFPVQAYGGLDGMKALKGPFPDISFVPSGGINSDNLHDFISSPLVYAVNGSWLCNKSDIAKGQFDRITHLCEEACKIIRDTARFHRKKYVP